VSALQTANGLEAVGGVGPLTRALLNLLAESNSTPVTTNTVQATSLSAENTNTCSGAVNLTGELTVGSRGSEVTQLQQFLVVQGYLTVAPTGYFGPLTEAACPPFRPPTASKR
jgi:peptidoglycan hydrolase-like protein with peptidoglycan-binding domain